MIKNITLVAIVLVFTILVGLFVFRHWFEFDNNKVKELLIAESKKFPGQEDAVYQTLHDSVMDILDSGARTRGVRHYAKNNKMPLETALVNTAIAHAQSLKYID